MHDDSDQVLWIYSPSGAFRFSSRILWQSIYAQVLKQGWQRPSADETGWLHSGLNPYPIGSFFPSADAKSFGIALEQCRDRETDGLVPHASSKGTELAELFLQGPIFVRLGPPRKTISTDLLEAVYAYACPQCGFAYHGSWLFNTSELTLEKIQASMKSLLESQYCPLCGSRELLSEAFLLPPFDPDSAPEVTWPQNGA
jgi:hypothetical protein